MYFLVFYATLITYQYTHHHRKYLLHTIYFNISYYFINFYLQISLFSFQLLPTQILGSQPAAGAMLQYFTHNHIIYIYINIPYLLINITLYFYLKNHLFYLKNHLFYLKNHTFYLKNHLFLP